MNLLGLVGPGNLGRTLAISLPANAFVLGPVLSRSRISSRRAVREMRRGYAACCWSALAEVSTILVSVPQAALTEALTAAVEQLPNLDGKHFLLTSLVDRAGQPVLQRLRNAGAHVGGLLPIAVYRRPSIVAPGTTFAVWGDVAARRSAARLVKAVRGQSVMIDDESGAQALLATGVFSGTLTTSLELAVRRLVRAGFKRHRAIEALAPLAESCLQEHRKSRFGSPPPRLPGDCASLRLAAEAAVSAREAALCQAALRFALEDLR